MALNKINTITAHTLSMQGTKVSSAMVVTRIKMSVSALRNDMSIICTFLILAAEKL